MFFQHHRLSTADRPKVPTSMSAAESTLSAAQRRAEARERLRTDRVRLTLAIRERRSLLNELSLLRRFEPGSLEADDGLEQHHPMLSALVGNTFVTIHPFTVKAFEVVQLKMFEHKHTRLLHAAILGPHSGDTGSLYQGSEVPNAVEALQGCCENSSNT